MFFTYPQPWRRRRKTTFADSICSEELIFQFSAKSDNIYYVFPQNSQNHSFILPPPLYVMHRKIIFFVSVKPFYTIAIAKMPRHAYKKKDFKTKKKDFLKRLQDFPFKV